MAPDIRNSADNGRGYQPEIDSFRCAGTCCVVVEDNAVSRRDSDICVCGGVVKRYGKALVIFNGCVTGYLDGDGLCCFARPEGNCPGR